MIIKYNISGGTPSYVVKLIGSENTIINTHQTNGTYQFSNISNGSYVLRGEDNNSCIFEKNVNVSDIIGGTKYFGFTKIPPIPNIPNCGDAYIINYSGIEIKRIGNENDEVNFELTIVPKPNFDPCGTSIRVYGKDNIFQEIGFGRVYECVINNYNDTVRIDFQFDFSCINCDSLFKEIYIDVFIVPLTENCEVSGNDRIVLNPSCVC